MPPTKPKDRRDTLTFHLLFATAIALASTLVIVAVTIDPWLLVALAGVGLTVFAIYDRTDPEWYSL